ncbi:MAG: helix-turn-helix transcriptional regulator [Methanobacteriota archaeon]
MNKKSTSINTILAGIGGLKHVLHLYAPNVSKYAIQTPFLAAAREDEEIFYVTREDPKSVANEFKQLGIELSIIQPEDLDTLKTVGSRKLRIVVDAGSIETGHEKREEFLTKNENNSALCTYDVSKLKPEMIERLVASHDKLILTTDDVTVLSSESLKELDVANEFIERFVKEYLDMVVLALIVRKPVCGMDIINIVHKNFNVLLSPGTIYPLLHELEENGLLECEYGIKKKIYRPVRSSEAKIRSILGEHLQTNEFLNRFLKSAGLEAAR